MSNHARIKEDEPATLGDTATATKGKSKMRLHRWNDLRNKKIPPEQRAETDRWVKQQILEMDLRELRERRGKTQIELAELIEMSQGEISRTERRKDHLVSTLRSIVEGLGGKLEITAVFDDERVGLDV